MKKLIVILLCIAGVVNAYAQTSRHVADSIKLVSAKKELTTFFQVADSVGLKTEINSGKPFTILAPDDRAFALWLSDSTKSSAYLKAGAKQKLTTLMQGHIVIGNLTSKTIYTAIRQNNGEAKFTTLAGTSITFKINVNRNIVLVDEKGVEHIVMQFDMPYDKSAELFIIDSVIN